MEMSIELRRDVEAMRWSDWDGIISLLIGTSCLERKICAVKL
jgi:hypothetical protein